MICGVSWQIQPLLSVHDGSVIALPWLEAWHGRGYRKEQILLRWYDSWHDACDQAAFDVDAYIASINWHPDVISDTSTWDDVSWDAPLMQPQEVHIRVDSPNVWAAYVRYLDTSRKHRKRMKRLLLRQRLFEAGDEFFLSVLARRKAVYEVKEQKRLQIRQRAAEIRFQTECNAIRENIERQLQSKDVPRTDTLEHQIFLVEKLVCCREAAMKETLMNNVRHVINKHVHHRRRKTILNHLGIPYGETNAGRSSKDRKKRNSKCMDGTQPDFDDSPARNTRSKVAEDSAENRRSST